MARLLGYTTWRQLCDLTDELDKALVMFNDTDTPLGIERTTRVRQLVTEMYQIVAADAARMSPQSTQLCGCDPGAKPPHTCAQHSSA